MDRVLKFVLGLVVAVAGAFFLVASTYALSQALRDQAFDQMLYPGIYGGVSLLAFLLGLRMAIRSVIPGFTFTRLIVVGAIVLVLLHTGGYISLSSSEVRDRAQSMQKWMRQMHKSTSDTIKKTDDQIREAVGG